MNGFVSELIERLRKEDISCVLVKGQVVAQCYEKPLLRSCGDIDLLLDDENYHKAKDYLTPFSSKIEVEDFYKKHFAMTINSWEVELHGTLRCGLWRKVEKTLDSIQTSIFYEKRFRTWIVGGLKYLFRILMKTLFMFSHIFYNIFLRRESVLDKYVTGVDFCGHIKILLIMVCCILVYALWGI